MPSASDKTCFVELNDHSLVAARTSSSSSPVTVEQIEEIRLDNKPTLVDAIGTIFPETKSGVARVICSLRPGKRFYHLATAEEAKKHASMAAVKTFAGQPPLSEHGASDLAAVLADAGGALDGKGSRWLLSGTPHDALTASVELLRELKLEPARIESATLSLLGAAQTGVSLAKDAGPLLIWEVGEKTSDMFIIGAEGVQAARRVSFGFDQIVEAIATEINLKFKASAAKLFFNDLYDFSESGPKIGARMAEQLQPEVAALALQSGRQPGQFVCAGFPAKQWWFTESLAKALKLTPWQPDVAAWCAKAGVKFASGTPEGFAAPWLSVLGVAGAYRADKAEHDSAWHPVWFRDGKEAPVEAKEPEKAAPAPAPAPAPAAKPAPAPVAAKTVAPAPVAAKKEAAPAPAKPAATPAPAKKEAAPAPVAKAATPAPAPAKKEAPAPAAKVAATPGAPAKKSFFATPAGMAAAAGIVLALGGGFFAFNSMQAAKAEAQKQAQLAEERARADAEALRLAQQKAAEESEARRKAEELAAQTATAADAARKQAEEEARLREEETRRLLNSRGSLRVVTAPAGATVVIDGMLTKEAPATFSDLRLGKYTAEISLSGYEPITIEIDVKDENIADPGVVRLVRQTGTLEVTSDPAGAFFEVRPSSDRFGSKSPDFKQGNTPAKIANLPTGEYVVTLLRDGWPSHTETVVVERNRETKIARNFAGGAVNVTSFPQGASVFVNGVSMGVTPLTLRDIPAGDIAVTLELSEYMPATASGRVELGKPLDLAVKLEPRDRIARISELDEKPLPIRTVQPAIIDDAKFKGKSVLVSFVVDTDGAPRDLKIERSNDDEFATLCVEAIAQWRFKPGTIRGEPVKARVNVPFVVK